ncbi:MAG: hypothetical protein WDN06_09700 [Asticcacaulis sp.]
MATAATRPCGATSPRAADHKLVLYDHTGSGRSDIAAYDKRKYNDLHGYADDLIEICEELGLERAEMPGSDLVVLDTHGHYPHLSAPGVVAAAMRGYLHQRLAA